MSKYKTGLVKAYQEKLKQDKLKEKHNIKQDDIVIVAKSDFFKQLFKVLKSIVKIIVAITIILFATIGLYCILSEETRNILINNANEMLSQMNL